MQTMVSLEAARQLVLRQASERPCPLQTLPLCEALDHTLSGDLIARLDQPPQPLSAMDGYAVRFTDMRAGACLRVIGAARAGVPCDLSVGSGEAVRIFTGACVPDGADHILIQEEAEADGQFVTVRQEQNGPASIRRTGRDFSRGDCLIPSGSRLCAGALSLAAAGGWGELPVRRPPSVGVLATGEELVPAGAAPQRGQISNSVSPAVCALISRWGGRAIDLGIARDTIEDITARIGTHCDVLVTIGGASVGDFDVVRPSFAACGFEPVFERIAMKPGKPTWFSVSGRRLALGLPGNPAAAMVTARLLLKPLIGALLGRQEEETRISAVSATRLGATQSREEYLRAVLGFRPDGVAMVTAAEDQDSALLNPFLSANALIVRPPRAPPLAAGEQVQVLMLEPPGPL